MKKLALVLMAVSASLFGLTAVANAYPPATSGTGTISTSNPRFGEPVRFTTPCLPSLRIVQSVYRDTFTFNGRTISWPTISIEEVPCTSNVGAASMLVSAPATGTATIVVTAPSEPGTYTVDYTGAATGSFSFTVSGAATPAAPGAPGGGLPATGSDSTGTMTMMAIGLFGVGAGLFGVSQMRRRNTVAA